MECFNNRSFLPDGNGFSDCFHTIRVKWLPEQRELGEEEPANTTDQLRRLVTSPPLGSTCSFRNRRTRRKVNLAYPKIQSFLAENKLLFRNAYQSEGKYSLMEG